MRSYIITALSIATLCLAASAFAPASSALSGSLRRGALPRGGVSAICSKTESQLDARETMAAPAAKGCGRTLAGPKDATVGDAPERFWVAMLAEPDPAEIILRSLKKLLR